MGSNGSVYHQQSDHQCGISHLAGSIRFSHRKKAYLGAVSMWMRGEAWASVQGIIYLYERNDTRDAPRQDIFGFGSIRATLRPTSDWPETGLRYYALDGQVSSCKVDDHPFVVQAHNGSKVHKTNAYCIGPAPCGFLAIRFGRSLRGIGTLSCMESMDCSLWRLEKLDLFGCWSYHVCVPHYSIAISHQWDEERFVGSGLVWLSGFVLSRFVNGLKELTVLVRG